MRDKPRLGVGAQDKKAKDAKPAEKKTLSEQDIFSRLHALLMQVKASHYATRSYAAHKAFDRTYKGLDDLADSISEQIIGYTGIRPEKFVLGSLEPLSATDMASMLCNFADELEAWAVAGRYPNIENLSQELSGVGAELKYLATLT